MADDAAGPALLNWDELDQSRYAPEEEALAALLGANPLDPSAQAGVVAEARDVVRKARSAGRRKGMMESFLEEFGLSNAEGLALMCLAEALLRVPDAETADKLIAEKIRSGRWAEHLGHSDNWLVNAGTWGLMLTGRVVGLSEDMRSDAPGFMNRFVARVGEPVVRAGAMQAMRILGEQFVLGRDIDAAIKRGKSLVRAGDAAFFSFDMLGEGARTAADAARYFDSYAEAIKAVGADGAGPPEARSGVSVKLSALHPRYEARQEERVMAELYGRVVELAALAKAGNIGFCLDAEESDRLVLSLKMLDRLAAEPRLRGWDGLGLAVQAYQKRARSVIAKLGELAQLRQTRLMVRLVKGAYWDGEIKRAQMQGRPDYPVFTTKQATDLSYIVCAADMLSLAPRLYPQFATHNAHTAMAVQRLAAAKGVKAFEFQRLHGMGEALYAAAKPDAPVRIYAPVGSHEDLLPYLVRRLLENGANTSFVHSFLDEDVSPELVAADPIARVQAAPRRHPRLPPPSGLYGASRRNSTGRDLSIAAERASLAAAVERLDAAPIDAVPLIGGDSVGGPGEPRRSPTDSDRIVGRSRDATVDDVRAAVAAAEASQPHWDGVGGVARARILRAMGDALESEADLFVALLAREAGRTLQDGIDEVREAVDFCRYYAAEAERLFGAPTVLPGPAGESNALELHGRGVFACISPWNFPLAIFTGQIAAALAAGNTVVAKPAEQTPLIAFEAVKRFLAAGLPQGVLSLTPGPGETVGAALTSDERVAGVVFTGSTETAKRIQRTLAERRGPIPVLIAETGGLNGMFVDTTALPEQVVDDAILSAFGSAGQRCSALRVLILPEDTAALIEQKLIGALAELTIGDPADPRTDIGPVIDAEARAMLSDHLQAIGPVGKVLARRDASTLPGSFFGPAIVSLPTVDLLEREVFGPILHIVRYRAGELEKVAKALAAKGYGLTLGVHSRLESFAASVMAASPAGNVYVNRSMIGAVVGVQPFGGAGLSGTGPKAGGPHYLPRFATERTVTVNIAAQGGDPALLNL